MTRDQQEKLWEAINRYTRSCGGDPDKVDRVTTPKGLARVEAVNEIEAIVREIERAERA